MNAEELKTLLKDKQMAERIIRFGSEVNEVTIQACLEKIQGLYYKDQEKAIVMHISTGGGNTSASHSFYQTVRLHGVNLITIASGRCASAGNMLLLSAAKEKRFSTPTTIFLVHPPRTTYKERRMCAKDLKEELVNMKLLEQFEEEIFVNETNITKEDYKKHIADDIYFTPEQAKEHGLVHEIISF